MILKTLFWRYFVVPRVRTAELDLRQPWKAVGDFQRGTKLRYETYSKNGFTPQLHVAIGSSDRTGVARRSKINSASSNRPWACVQHGSQVCEVFEAEKGTGVIRRVLEQLQKSDLHVRESSSMEAKKKEEEEEKL